MQPEPTVSTEKETKKWKVIHFSFIGGFTVLAYFATGEFVPTAEALILSTLLIALINQGHYSKIDEALQAGDYEKALELSEKLIQKDPKLIKAYIVGAKAAIYLDNYDKAIELCTKALEKDPEEVKAYAIRSDIYRVLGELEKAKEDARTAIAVNEESPEGYQMLASAQFSELNFEEAFENSQKAIDRYTKTWHPYLSKAKALTRLNRYDDAFIACNDALEQLKVGDTETLNSWQGKFLTQRAVIFSFKADYDAALDDLNRVLASIPDSDLPRLERAFIYALQDKEKEALADIEKFREYNSTEDYESAINEIQALVLLASNKNSEALEKIEIAISKGKEKDPQAYSIRGLSYARQKKYDLAISDFTKSLEIDPYWVDAYWLRHRVYEVTGEEDKSKADKEKAESFSYIPMLDIE